MSTSLDAAGPGGTGGRVMSEPAFFILTALVDQPRHGYGIVGEVDRLSGGRVQLRVGTLYGVLDRLVGDGLVELDREEVERGRLRRYFRLNEAGGRALAAEAERQAANARTATERLRGWQPAKADTQTTAERPRGWQPVRAT